MLQKTKSLRQNYLNRKELRKRKKGQRAEDMRFATVEVDDYAMSEEELDEIFPDGYTELGYKTSHRLEYITEKLVLHEEHIHQYKAKKSDRYVSADHPRHLLEHSMVTPSLAGGIINAKFVNAIPINRLSKSFEAQDALIRPQTMSRWIINLDDKYFDPLVKRMKAVMVEKAELIHCDETPFIVEQDHKLPGKTKNSKSYMWVYHTADEYGAPPVFIYDYHSDRNGDNAAEFLKGFEGYVMTDGFDGYNKPVRATGGKIKRAGCWAHLKRKAVEVIKTNPKNAKGTVAYEINSRIAAIYHVDNMMKDALPEERLKHRKANVEPLVDSFFEWIKKCNGKVASSHTQTAITYAINQEERLRAFLSDGIIPLDNSDAERSIRAFCVGKHAWHIVATSSGAKASGDLYSVAETAKANGLKPSRYFTYVLDQMLQSEYYETKEYPDEFLDSLLPWSEAIPDEIKIKDMKKYKE